MTRISLLRFKVEIMKKVYNKTETVLSGRIFLALQRNKYQVRGCGLKLGSSWEAFCGIDFFGFDVLFKDQPKICIQYSDIGNILHLASVL